MESFAAFTLVGPFLPPSTGGSPQILLAKVNLVGLPGFIRTELRPAKLRGRKSSKRVTYVADFETTTDPDDCRVWGWGLCALGEDWKALTLDSVEVGTDLVSFLDRISDGNATVYFHNLKFDGRFILDHLLRIGYTHRPTDHAHGRRPDAGTFSTVISDMGDFYSLTVRWGNGRTTEFRDSYKKLPMSVAAVARTFDMDTSKGDIDYEAPRPVGYRITAAEADYIRRDVHIVARALGQQLANGLTRLTVGADALAEHKRLTGTSQWNRLFPTLSLPMDAEIRKAYRGGFTYADPRFSGRRVGAGSVYDVNSLYPSVMYDKPIPYGEPAWCDGYPQGTSSHPLTIFSLTFTARVKDGHVPCIQIKGSTRFAPTEYLTVIPEPTTLMVTNVDYALMCDHYDVDVLEFGGGWRFKAATGLFTEYIDKWTRIKTHSTGGMRALAKLQLNSLYGKFATNPNVTGKVPVLDEQGILRLKVGASEFREPVYTAAGVFITSYARDVTVRAAQANFDAFAYADTDSLHLLGDREPAGLTVHPDRLGAWKHEYDFDAAWYLRPKAYLEREFSGRYHNAVAGVPVGMSAALTFGDLTPGWELTIGKDGRITGRREVPELERSILIRGKLTPKAVPGGVVLTDIPYELQL